MKLILLRIIGLKLTGIFIFVMIYFTNGYSQNNNGICIDDSFYVPSNFSLYVNSDFKLESASNFKLEGRCVFFNSSTVELSDYFIGDGSLILRGDLDVSVIINNTQIGSLFAEMNGANINLEGNLDVVNSLTLSSGKIITDFDNAIFVSNSAESAINYNEDALSDSYIVGNLKRAVDEGGSYYYPVGNINGYHPFYIRNSSSAGHVQVSFDEGVPGLWEMSRNTSSVKLQETGAWVVEVLSGFDMHFTAGLSILDSYQELLSDPGNVFYASNLNFSESDISSESASSLPYYLEGDFKYSSGVYALVESAAEMDQITNTLLVNGYDDSRFKLDLSKFQSIRLIIFDSFGREVYKSNDYQNEFDAQQMQSGTYYYDLKGKLTNGQAYNHNDFIEVIRTN
jgi:hypothetical protein